MPCCGRDGTTRCSSSGCELFSPSKWLMVFHGSVFALCQGCLVPPAAHRSSVHHIPPGRTLQADICQLGLDQRKVNMLAREYCDDCRPKRKLKPIILSHEMLPGLLQVRPGRGDALHSCFAEPCIQWLHQLVWAVYPCALQHHGLDMPHSLMQSAVQDTGTMRSISPSSLHCIAGHTGTIHSMLPCDLVVHVWTSWRHAKPPPQQPPCAAGAGENVQE